MTREEALKQLREVEELRNKAEKIINIIVINSPYGEYKGLWRLMFENFESAEETLKQSRLFG